MVTNIFKNRFGIIHHSLANRISLLYLAQRDQFVDVIFNAFVQKVVFVTVVQINGTAVNIGTLRYLVNGDLFKIFF
ncbi:hypothetical protein D3C73_1015430 [compost metagenome]